MIYRVTHTTAYAYEDAVSISHHVARVQPRQTPNQVCHEFRLCITPTPGVISERLDYFGNHVTFFTVERSSPRLTVTSSSLVEVSSPTLPAPADTHPWETIAETCQAIHPGDNWRSCEFAAESPLTPTTDELKRYALHSFSPGRPVLEAGLDLTARIHREFKFDPTATTVSTTVQEVFARRRGVCQDFAHLQLSCLRSLGLPARYVSGYLETTPPPGRKKLVGADASHAWVSIWCGDQGWIDLDPTNNISPRDQHIVIGWGRDYNDVAPLRGVLVGGGRDQSLRVAVDVERAELIPPQTQQQTQSQAQSQSPEPPADFSL